MPLPKWVCTPIFDMKEMEILVRYLEGDTDFEVLEGIEYITYYLRRHLDKKIEELQKPDS